MAQPQHARAALSLSLALAAALALAPAAAADGGASGTTSTGDVDAYGTYPSTETMRCPAIYTTWDVTLTLGEPVPGDRVLLSAEGTILDVADAAVATYEDPEVSVRVDGDGCTPPTQVTGLTVGGDLGYEISWRYGVGY